MEEVFVTNLFSFFPSFLVLGSGFNTLIFASDFVGLHKGEHGPGIFASLEQPISAEGAQWAGTLWPRPQAHYQAAPAAGFTDQEWAGLGDHGRAQFSV